MYKIVKDVINAKNYELTDMLKKVKTMWVEGDISDVQKEELVELARTNAKAENSYAPLQNQIDTLFANVKELAQEVLALKNGGALPDEETEEYPAWVQPTGSHDAYNTGDKMTYTDGNKYICQKDGCVWGPDTYPQGWQLVTEDAEQDSEKVVDTE